MTPVEMPKLGNTVEECLLAVWRKRPGDPVAAGEVIAEIETDKTNFELTAPTDGTILEEFFEEGALVPVFTTICVIGAAGENAGMYRPGGAPAPLPVAEPVGEPEIPAAVAAARTPAAMAVPETPAPYSPRARRFADRHHFHPQAVTGSGPEGRVLEEDLRRLYYAAPRPTQVAQQRLAAGLVATSGGTGLGGMIRAADLAPAAAPQMALPPSTPAPARAAPPATPAPVSFVADRGAAPARVSGIREKIARRMRESLSSTAQYTMHASANAAGLLAVRRKIKASSILPAITINDLVHYCTIRALLRVPELNAEFIDGKLYRHPNIHLGFACDTDRGLMVPVIRISQDLTLAELALRAKDLAARAVQGTISPDDLVGGTFTVSNLGSLGVESFTPLLNPPQVGILGVNTIQLKPVRKPDGNIEFIDAIGLSLTVDHQVIDGAPGARFLKVVREMIENVETLCTI